MAERTVLLDATESGSAGQATRRLFYSRTKNRSPWAITRRCVVSGISEPDTMVA